MMQQYLEIKENNQNSILFYRMGDFYEMFLDDAIIASKILGITLTSRNNKADTAKVPMCGIPYHAAQSYLAKLVKAGHRVAICEQTEDPSTAKGIVRREVVRTISPGVVTDDQLLDDKSNHYVAAISKQEKGAAQIFGLSFLDLSTGQFLIGEFLDTENSYDNVIDQLSRLNPAELLVDSSKSDNLKDFLDAVETFLPQLCLTKRDESLFHLQSCRELLLDHFNVINLSGFGCESMQCGIVAAGVLLDYVREMQKTNVDHVERITPIDLGDVLLIDDSSRRNLELTQTIIGGTREGSLLSVLDKTSTPMGARLLKNYLLFPLQDVNRINGRLDCVNYLYKNSSLRHDISVELNTIYDIERLNSRMVLGNGNGRDMLAMKQSLARLPLLHSLIEQCKTQKFQDIYEQFETLSEVFDLLEAAIHEQPPVTLRDGNLIKEGYNDELDEYAHLLRHGKQLILDLEAQERKATGIAKLKIGYNRVFGYFLEVSKIHSSKVPEHYIRKQTLANAERFITPELKEFETKVLSAQDRRLELEYTLFIEIRQKTAEQSTRLLKIANLLAQIDLFASFAEIAHLNHYRRPVVEDGKEIKIIEGRHPVIEKSLPGGKFVPNDVHLNQTTDEVIIITGPNMAGKSTVLRQTALIVTMAQMGSFVPADEARIGVVDRIFTRVGAMDDLRRGQSTFMVEMNETANILNNATTKSLVILDEIGRGTSTFDGLAIAWAVAEHLVMKDNRGVKTLFATHYHELTELARQQERVQNFSIAVREWNETIIFLHKLVRGGTNRSYGIQVAGLAGVPDNVVNRAKEILRNIETGDFSGTVNPTFLKKSVAASEKKNTNPNQLSLFQPPTDPLRQYLTKLNIDDLTPRQALEILYELDRLSSS
jgi:DNA mismatch repair protein MutS